MIEVEKPADLQAYVGQKLGTSEWIIVDQTKIDDFARLTGDDNWIHVDVERARHSALGFPAPVPAASSKPVCAVDVVVRYALARGGAQREESES